VTLQTDRNVAAVGSLQELAAVLIPNGRQPQEDLLDLARDEKVNILSTPLSTYEVVGRLYALSIRGVRGELSDL
jgi:predicted transcriptional regulator